MFQACLCMRGTDSLSMSRLHFFSALRAQESERFLPTLACCCALWRRASTDREVHRKHPCGARRSSQTQKVHKKMTQNGYPTFDGDEKSTLLKKVQTKDAWDEKGMLWRLGGQKAFVLDEFRKWWRVDSTEFKYVQVSDTCCWMPFVQGVFLPLLPAMWIVCQRKLRWDSVSFARALYATT